MTSIRKRLSQIWRRSSDDERPNGHEPYTLAHRGSISSGHSASSSLYTPSTANPQEMAASVEQLPPRGLHKVASTTFQSVSDTVRSKARVFYISPTAADTRPADRTEEMPKAHQPRSSMGSQAAKSQRSRGGLEDPHESGRNPPTTMKVVGRSQRGTPTVNGKISSSFLGDSKHSGHFENGIDKGSAEIADQAATLTPREPRQLWPGPIHAVWQQFSKINLAASGVPSSPMIGDLRVDNSSEDFIYDSAMFDPALRLPPSSPKDQGLTQESEGDSGDGEGEAAFGGTKIPILASDSPSPSTPQEAAAMTLKHFSFPSVVKGRQTSWVAPGTDDTSPDSAPAQNEAGDAVAVSQAVDMTHKSSISSDMTERPPAYSERIQRRSENDTTSPTSASDKSTASLGSEAQTDRKRRPSSSVHWADEESAVTSPEVSAMGPHDEWDSRGECNGNDRMVAMCRMHDDEAKTVEDSESGPELERSSAREFPGNAVGCSEEAADEFDDIPMEQPPPLEPLSSLDAEGKVVVPRLIELDKRVLALIGTAPAFGHWDVVRAFRVLKMNWDTIPSGKYEASVFFRSFADKLFYTWDRFETETMDVTDLWIRPHLLWDKGEMAEIEAKILASDPSPGLAHGNYDQEDWDEDGDEEPYEEKRVWDGIGDAQPYGDGYEEPWGDGYEEPWGDGYKEPYGDGYKEPYGDDSEEPYRDGYEEWYGDDHDEPYANDHKEPFADDHEESYAGEHEKPEAIDHEKSYAGEHEKPEAIDHEESDAGEHEKPEAIDHEESDAGEHEKPEAIDHEESDAGEHEKPEAIDHEESDARDPFSRGRKINHEEQDARESLSDAGIMDYVKESQRGFPRLGVRATWTRSHSIDGSRGFEYTSTSVSSADGECGNGNNSSKNDERDNCDALEDDECISSSKGSSMRDQSERTASLAQDGANDSSSSPDFALQPDRTLCPDLKSDLEEYSNSSVSQAAGVRKEPDENEHIRHVPDDPDRTFDAATLTDFKRDFQPPAFGTEKFGAISAKSDNFQQRPKVMSGRPKRFDHLYQLRHLRTRLNNGITARTWPNYNGNNGPILTKKGDGNEPGNRFIYVSGNIPGLTQDKKRVTPLPLRSKTRRRLRELDALAREEKEATMRGGWSGVFGGEIDNKGLRVYFS